LEGAVDIGCGFDEYIIFVFVYIYLILIIIVGFDPCSHVGPYFKFFLCGGDLGVWGRFRPPFYPNGYGL
jgi:hypothetical protein